MSLRRATPLAFHPRGVSDALDSSLVFSGAMMALSDLIPDPSTKGLWQCRPASVLLGDMAGTGGAFSSGFSSGFLLPSGSIFPSPFGVVSCLLVVGDVAYGMVTTGPQVGITQQDYPFAFDLKTNKFTAITGIVGGGSGNLPTSQLAAGDWTPPTMDVIGSTILVTHPGFNGTGNYLGTIDISNVSAPVWSAGNITGAGGFLFTTSTRAPVAVKAFNGRAYWAFNPLSGPSATVFSDVLEPTTVTNAGTVQIISYDDNVPVTALGALPLSNQLGGIIQSLMVFKGVSNIYQITGDIALGSGPPLGTLQRNTLNVATGTFAPNSIAATTKGLAFVAPDGVRIIDFNAQVSDPIGNEGMGKTLPFLLAVAPSRIAAAANGTVYRVVVQDGSRSGSPLSEYWLDFSRGGIWSGPHSFPARMIKPYKNTFVIAPYAAPHTLQQSDYLQSLASTFTENNTQMTFTWLTSLLPDTDQMCENAMLETTLYIGQAEGSSYVVQALNESSSVLRSVTLGTPPSAAIWGSFTWGQADWGGIPAVLFPQLIPWPRQIVFRRMAIAVSGPASQQFRIGTLHMRYEQLGYITQPLGAMEIIPAPPVPIPPTPAPMALELRQDMGTELRQDAGNELRQ
jgi:hypothetical protein